MPQLLIEEQYNKYAFPLLGYHILSDDSSKHIEYKSISGNKNTMTILKKISSFRHKGTASIQVFLALLETCIDNHELLKYIRRIPSEEVRFESFIDFGVTMINSYTNKTDNNYYFDKLKDIVNILNPIMDTVLSNDTILNNHKGFIGKFLIKDIKKEEITLIRQIDNIYIFQIEYFTNTVSINEVIDFTNSKSYVTGSMNLLDDNENVQKMMKEKDEKLEMSNVIEETMKDIPIDTLLLNDHNKINVTEREFYKKLIVNFTQYKKVVVENKYSVMNNNPTLKRFVVLNSIYIYNCRFE